MSRVQLSITIKCDYEYSSENYPKGTLEDHLRMDKEAYEKDPLLVADLLCNGDYTLEVEARLCDLTGFPKDPVQVPTQTQ